TTLAMQEVREAAAVIVVHEQRKDSADPPMHIELKISIADHAALGQVTEQLTQSVQQHIHEVLGVAEVPVKISVTEIGASGAAKRSVA
ncbi:MAG: alkaline shock response membrane anchor protein AmaP, partial [Selenomonas sp.]|nr:alkaline shock response membrane anchor protein AmaP [Selenomonas sp.]